MGKSKLHIVIFDGTFQTTAFIRRLILGLQKEHQVYVLGFNENLKEPISRVKYVSLGDNNSKLKLSYTSIQLALQTFSIPIILNTLTRILSGKRKKLQEQNLQLQLKKINPDVIHAQWNSVLPWLEPYLTHKTYPIILSQRGFHTNVRPFINSDNKNYLQEWYPKLSGIHSVSKAISKKGKKIGIPRSHIDEVVYTGLDFSKFPAIKSSKQTDKLRIISVGRPHWIKGYTYALETMRILAEQQLDFEYIIVGAFGDEELTYLIQEFNLQDKVKLTSKLEQEEVFNRMKNASLFLLPSLEEGIANVAVEAMALGVPVISTNCGGMEELIAHDIEGWVVPIRDPQALAAQIKTFISLKEFQIKNVCIAARKKVEQQHSETKMITNMINLYHTTKNTT
ncbi:colanic acid/amylovoran biosynthesis glycosyltransferase [Mesonia algae]|uniref:Colanic acid/amylovoran biosynthesis glycosyltransferase n=1 Tax=Mesonia algae TaxID=213248 RepID=A0A2W7I1C4_9FLAO|nr:glycosyltransferase family 4 protein [Mesonia algae]PZW39065.1 colanic acid/amylovoran biosynthesis glycosyltransferase [Mesonia algae]